MDELSGGVAVDRFQKVTIRPSKRCIQVALATQRLITGIECALILQPQVVDLEEAPS